MFLFIPTFRQRPLVPAFCVLALLLFRGEAFGQACSDGKITITVHDPSGASIGEARVELRTGVGVAASQSTGADGVAVFPQISCGIYALSIFKFGFEPASREGVAVTGTATLELSADLTPKAAPKESVEVHATMNEVEQGSSAGEAVRAKEVKDLPSKPATVADVLPLLPGVARAADGSLQINGSGEHRSALLVNKADVTDPATGKFGQTVPVDSIEEMNVMKTPFMAQYGRFSAGLVSVETRRGGDKWHADLNDPFPDFRFRSWHMEGIRDASPRAVFGGPLIANKLYLAETLLYDIRKTPSRTLPYPFNESKQETVNTFTQIDYILSPKQILTGTLHVTPQHINFVDPQYFMPQPVTPNYRQQEYAGTVIHHLAIGGGTVDSTISFQRFDANIGAQGVEDMILTPTGNRGNYFSGQAREAGRTEWLETWSPAIRNLGGAHEVRVGSVVAGTSNDGQFSARPIDILDNSGELLRRISFTNAGPYSRSDLETAFYVQDHWLIRPNLVFDTGVRFERQRIAQSFRVAPRAGMAWTPFAGQSTVIRAGYGEFYDRVPLNVYAFRHYPGQVITDYDANGNIVGDPVAYANIIGTVFHPKAFWVRGSKGPGSFAPRSATWNVQVEQTISRVVRLRATYTDSQSSGLIVMQPQSTEDGSALLLNGTGHGQYRQAEITARFQWTKTQFFVAYTRSRAEGDLNDFGSYLGNFPSPLVRPNSYSLLPTDLPNRVLAWGRATLPYKMHLMPTIEYRSGFPYARYDALGSYVGTPYDTRTRYPNLISVDASLSKDFQVNPKYALRLAVTGLNLTNHFNALAIHSNIDDPQFGTFFGTYKRRFRVDFDVIF